MFHAPSITLNTFSSKSYLLVSFIWICGVIWARVCVFFPSLVRLPSCLLSDLTSDRASCRSAESLDLWPLTSVQRPSVWQHVLNKRLKETVWRGYRLQKNTKQTKPLASAPFDSFTPESWRSAEETDFPFVRWFQGVWFEAVGCSRAAFPPRVLFKAQ